MAGSIIVPVLGLIQEALGVGGTAAGLIVTTHGLAIAVLSPFAGWAIDRWGVRRPLAAGLLLYGVAGGAGVVVSSLPALLVSRVLFGAGAAVVYTGSTVAMLSLYSGSLRDRVMGWRGTAAFVGGVFWPLLGGALGLLSWQGPFAAYLIGVPLGLGVLWLVSDPARPAPGLPRGSFLALVRGRSLLPGLYGLQTIAAVLLYALSVFLPQRLAEVGIRSPLLVSLFVATTSVAGSLVGLVWARIRQRTSYNLQLRAAALLWVATFGLLGTTGHPGLIAAAAALFGLGIGLAFPALSMLIGDAAPLSLRGQATSLAATSLFFGQFISPLLLGPLVAVTAITTGYLVTAGAAALVLVALLVANVDVRPVGAGAGAVETGVRQLR